MTKRKVAINGFGRIGRNTLRAAIREGIFDKIDYVAINDPGLKPADAARIFKYDSVMGKFDGEVEAYDEGIIINGKKIKFFAEKDPAQLPWKDLGVEVVISSARVFIFKLVKILLKLSMTPLGAPVLPDEN